MRERFPGCPLIICRDDDWKTKRPNGDPWNPGEEKANNAALIVGGQVVAPVFSGERETKWTDFNDLHVAEGLEAVRRQVLAVVRPPAVGGWKDQFARTENGSLIAHMQNVELILGNDERWAGVIGFSAFSSKIVKLRAAPYGGGVGDWADIDDVLVMKWLAQQYNLRVKASSVIEAVSVVAHDHAFHPVRNYLHGLEWDRVPRLAKYSKAEVMLLNLCQPGEYTDDLFATSQPAESTQVMTVLDKINERWGRGTLRSASVPADPEWGMRREMMSQCYTTRLDQLWSIPCI